jgi:hypothetical protein
MYLVKPSSYCWQPTQAVIVFLILYSIQRRYLSLILPGYLLYNLHILLE